MGTSESFNENPLAQEVFASQGASEVPVWWDGDGSTACANFQALLDARPDVCFGISGDSTFSTEQVAELDAEGITYVSLPALNSIQHIEDAVTIVGQVLGDDAESLASNYCRWAYDTISWAQGNNYTKKATTYIGRWEGDAHWTIESAQGRGELARGDGAPVSMAYNINGTSTLNECMGYAGVINTATDNYYVEPLYKVEWGPTISGGTGKYPLNREIYTVFSEDLNVGLGTATFPAVVVADSTIKDNILTGDYYWYHWQAGETINYKNSKIYGINLNDGTFLSTYIQNEQAYDIWVNPSGAGNWAKGSVESPLEAAWLACKFQGRDMGELRNMVSDFYSTFYGYQVDTAAVLVD